MYTDIRIIQNLQICRLSMLGLYTRCNRYIGRMSRSHCCCNLPNRYRRYFVILLDFVEIGIRLYHSIWLNLSVFSPWIGTYPNYHISNTHLNLYNGWLIPWSYWITSHSIWYRLYAFCHRFEHRFVGYLWWLLSRGGPARLSSSWGESAYDSCWWYLGGFLLWLRLNRF